MLKQKKLWMALVLSLVMIVGFGCNGKDTPKEDAANDTSENGGTEEVASDGIPEIPSTDELDPDHPLTDVIKYGEEVFNETNTVIPDYVGNELSCQSCHADGGLSASSTLVGVVADYPQYRPREGVPFTLEDRINGCMIRSMNGEMLPYDSEEMRALMAYFSHISQGVAIGEERPWFTPNSMDEVPEPDVVNGEELYVSKNCMTCHGENGEGTGANTGPALWGDNSFNNGAGLTRLTKMAGYIQNNMPIGDVGELSDQEAADLAAYILMQDRPVFSGLDGDFPHGGEPSDFIRGEERLQKIRDGEFDWFEIDNVVESKE